MLMELSCLLNFGVSVDCILVFGCGSVSTNCTFYFAYCPLESRGGCGEHRVLLRFQISILPGPCFDVVGSVSSLTSGKQTSLQ
jgi:hypothetical protein